MGWRGLYEGVGLDLALACRGRWVRRILSRVKVRLRWVSSANTGGHGFNRLTSGRLHRVSFRFHACFWEEHVRAAGTLFQVQSVCLWDGIECQHGVINGQGRFLEVHLGGN